MRSSHGFTVPYQDHLTVDLETFVWYLHMVVHGYHECLACGARKRTAEATVQHMSSKGHCRLDVTGELAEFYEVDKIGADMVKMEAGGKEVRLADGRVVESRREAGESSQRSSRRTRNDPYPSHAGIEGSTSEGQTPRPTGSGHGGGSSGTSKMLQKRARKEEAMTVVLGRLSANDQMSLAHLPASEQRAWLATRKRELDRVGREERRARAKVERLGNKTLMRHFKPDAPARANG